MIGLDLFTNSLVKQLGLEGVGYNSLEVNHHLKQWWFFLVDDFHPYLKNGETRKPTYYKCWTSSVYIIELSPSQQWPQESNWFCRWYMLPSTTDYEIYEGTTQSIYIP